MHKSQVNLSVTRKRAANRVLTPSTEPVSRNPARRAPDRPTVTGVGPRRGRSKKAWAHRDVTGRTSQWHGNPFYFCPVEIDARWTA